MIHHCSEHWGILVPIAIGMVCGVYTLIMVTDNYVEEVWDDEDPEVEITEVDDVPVERMRIELTARQEPLRIERGAQRVAGGVKRHAKCIPDDLKDIAVVWFHCGSQNGVVARP